MSHDNTGGGSVEGDTTEPEDVALAHVPPDLHLEVPEDEDVVVVPTRIEVTRRRSAELFGQMRDADGSDASRTTARDDLVHLHLPLVEHCARRFRNRGEPHEDLVQVGTIGLIKAVDRFETDRGVEFSTYATPTIIGEIKRYFRDKGWAIRVPRRLQELRMQIGASTAELTQRLGRSPTPRELAEAIGCTVEEIIEGMESSNAYSTLSLDASDSSDDGPPSMLETLGVDDEGLEHVEIRESIKPLLEGLGAREKRILLLRFFKNMTQSQIAEEIGVSQMHVSRLLTKTLAQLRASLEAEYGPGLSAGRLEGLDALRVHEAGHHDQCHHPDAQGQQGRVAAAQVPGQAELDQLGQQDRATGPGAAPGDQPARTPPAGRRTARRTAWWSAPWSAARRSGRRPRGPRAGRSHALDRGERGRGHERGGAVAARWITRPA